MINKYHRIGGENPLLSIGKVVFSHVFTSTLRACIIEHLSLISIYHSIPMLYRSSLFSYHSELFVPRLLCRCRTDGRTKHKHCHMPMDRFQLWWIGCHHLYTHFSTSCFTELASTRQFCCSNSNLSHSAHSNCIRANRRQSSASSECVRSPSTNSLRPHFSNVLEPIAHRFGMSELLISCLGFRIARYLTN